MQFPIKKLPVNYILIDDNYSATYLDFRIRQHPMYFLQEIPRCVCLWFYAQQSTKSLEKKCVTASQLLKFAQMAMNKHTLQQSTNE